MNPNQCPHCQSEIPTQAGFCPNCGKSLAEEEQTAVKTSVEAETACPRCGKGYPPPAPAFCMACGFPMQNTAPPISPASPPQTSPPVTPSSGWQSFTEDTATATTGATSEQPRSVPSASKRVSEKRTSKIRPGRYLPFILGGIVLIALIFGARSIWSWWQSKGETPVLVEACTPVDPDEHYESANQRDLEGELRRDSYFAEGEEYTIAENAAFTIPEGVTLIIEPGARVKFGPGAKMVIKGTLLACGRSSKRILFTADTTSGRPGFWAGIEFQDADPESVLGHASFEFAGKDGHAPLWFNQTDLHLENLKFDSNQWYALSLDPNSYPRLRPPLTVENGPQGWEVRGGQLDQHQTWNQEQDYIINGVVEIGEEAALMIPAATWVKFQPGSGLNVYGELTASGRSGNPVHFTSVNDAAEEGALEPQTGDWTGIRFWGQEAESSLEEVEIRYAGAENRERGCLWLESANPVLKNVSISECAGFAISTDLASNPEIERFKISEVDPLRRWELRGSTLEGVTQKELIPLTTADREPLYPVVTGWVGVGEKATLTVDEDFTFLFAGGQNAGFWSDGDLRLNGSERKPIVMTSWRDPAINPEGEAQPGDWGGLHLSKTSSDPSTLTNLRIRYAGAVENTCFLLRSSSPTIKDLIIRDCAAFPISSNAAAQPNIDSVDITENEHANLWEIRESKLEERAEWEWKSIQGRDKTQIIRLITGLITIEEAAMLKLQPGLVLKFTDGKGFIVRGDLLVEGENKAPVILTSWRDPEGGGSESGPQPGDWGGVVLDGSQGSDLRHLSIRYAGRPQNSVGCLNLKESSPTIDHLTVMHCNYYPITSDLASDPTVENLTLSENQPTNEWAVRESKLSKGNTRIWRVLTQAEGDEPVLRVITGWLTIEEGANLTLSEGVVLKFNNGVGARTIGQLNVEGKENNPVIFTSWRDAEFSQEAGIQSGDWVGLVFDGTQANTSLRHAEVRYAGGSHKPQGAVILTKASPVLEAVSIQDSAWYPISMDVQSTPQIQALNLVGNTPADAIEVRGGNLDIAGEQVWSPWTEAAKEPLVRVVTGNIKIGPEASLRMDRGTVVKFGAEGGLEVHGSLVTQDAVLTSLHDDDFGGDTDGPDVGEPSWQGVKIFGRGLTRLEDTLIRFGQFGVRMEDAAPTLLNLRIEDSWGAALLSDILSSPVITNLQLAGNSINGILIYSEAFPEGATHWDLIGSQDHQIVRVIQKPLRISATSELILAPGLTVKFAPQAALLVEGILRAGQNGQPTVSFTALSDDRVSGDTDGITQQPNRGYWQGIQVNPNNTEVQVHLFQVEIRYATTGLDLVNPFNWEIGELKITESQLYGVACQTPLAFLDENPDITLMNNGEDSYNCPLREEEP